MNDYKTNLEGLLLSYYIRYDQLFKLCNAYLSNINSGSVDIYVDLYDMLKPIYTRDVHANKKYIIVSSIINLAAHLRSYFWTRHRLMTRIFLVYGESITYQHKQFYPEFGDEKFTQTINFNENNEFIHSQLKLVKILCAYVNDVYFVQKQSNFSMFVYDNICKNKELPAVIISKSKYAYQIPALLPNAVIFRPKKRNGMDISYGVTGALVYRKLFNKISSESTLNRLAEINPSLLSLMITLTGLPSYNLRTLMNVSTATKILYDAIAELRIVNGYNSNIDFIYGALYGIERYIDDTSFKCRFNAVDLLTQHRIYRSTAESQDISWFINLYDPASIRDINNRYFVDNPLDLNSL